MKARRALPPEPDMVLITTDELAARWKLKPRTLERWRYDRSFGPRWIRVGGQVRYRLSDVLLYEKERRTK